MNQRFLVEVEAMPDVNPPQVRLRQLLKIALRGLRLRCLRVVEPGEEEAAADAADPELQRALAVGFYESIIRSKSSTVAERLAAQERIDKLLGLEASR